MKLKKIMLSTMIAAMGLLSFPAKAQDNNMMPDIKNWPEASQMAAKEMMDKYGKPTESTPHMLVWYDNQGFLIKPFAESKTELAS